MRIRIPLTANIPARQSFKAQCVVIADTGLAPSVDFNLFGTDVQDVEGFGQCERLFSVFAPDRTFTGVELTASVDCVVELLVSRSRIEVMEGANVTATIAASQLPLQVQNDKGDSAINPLYVSGAILGDTPANTVTDTAAVAVGAAAAQVLAADPDRMEVVWYNQGPDAMTLGMPGITWAKRAIVLSAGDTYIESRAAHKEWHALRDPAGAGTSALTAQVRKA